MTKLKAEMMENRIEWIAVEVGSGFARFWVVSTKIERGTFEFDAGGFDHALILALSPYLDTADRLQVFVNNLDVTALQSVPIKAEAIAMRSPEIDPRLEVLRYNGFSQKNPADLLIQEATQIIGYLTQQPEFDGVLCVAGDETKWVRISAGEIVSFSSFTTSELYHSLGAHGFAVNWDQDHFLSGVELGYSSPGKFASRLSTLKAEQVLNAMPKATADANLGGLLIGIEIAGARAYWLGMQVVIIGEDGSTQAYQSALSAQGLNCEIYPAQAARLHGIKLIRDTHNGDDDDQPLH